MEPPYADPHVRWCERSASQLMASLLLDTRKKLMNRQAAVTALVFAERLGLQIGPQIVDNDLFAALEAACHREMFDKKVFVQCGLIDAQVFVYDCILQPVDIN